MFLKPVEYATNDRKIIKDSVLVCACVIFDFNAKFRRKSKGLFDKQLQQ